jgi:hypothetical protein
MLSREIPVTFPFLL